MFLAISVVSLQLFTPSHSVKHVALSVLTLPYACVAEVVSMNATEAHA